MKVLLDTAPFLWLITDPKELSETGLDVIRSAESEMFLSPISAWEISVKHALGGLTLAEPPETLIPRERERHGVLSLPLDEVSALYHGKLPRIHKDPFDRMLICQAIIHGLTILTPDEAIRRYPVRTLW